MGGLLRFIGVLAFLSIVFLVIFALVVPALGLPVEAVVVSVAVALLTMLTWYLRRISYYRDR